MARPTARAAAQLARPWRRPARIQITVTVRPSSMASSSIGWTGQEVAGADSVGPGGQNQPDRVQPQHDRPGPQAPPPERYAADDDKRQADQGQSRKPWARWLVSSWARLSGRRHKASARSAAQRGRAVAEDSRGCPGVERPILPGQPGRQPEPAGQGRAGGQDGQSPPAGRPGPSSTNPSASGPSTSSPGVRIASATAVADQGPQPASPPTAARWCATVQRTAQTAARTARGTDAVRGQEEPVGQARRQRHRQGLRRFAASAHDAVDQPQAGQPAEANRQVRPPEARPEGPRGPAGAIGGPGATSVCTWPLKRCPGRPPGPARTQVRALSGVGGRSPPSRRGRWRRRAPAAIHAHGG